MMEGLAVRGEHTGLVWREQVQVAGTVVWEHHGGEGGRQQQEAECRPLHSWHRSERLPRHLVGYTRNSPNRHGK